MNKSDFFRILREKLPQDSYKSRFLEELKEHLEDAEYVDDFGAKDPQADALKRLGDPEFIINNYKKLMKNKSDLYIYADTVFWGTLSIPVYILVFLSNSVTEFTEVFWQKVLLWLVTLVFVCGIFHVFYGFLYFQVKNIHVVLSRRQKLFAFLLSLLPPWIFSFLFMLTFYFGDSDTRQDYLFPLVILSYLISAAFGAWLAYIRVSKGEQKLTRATPLFEAVLVLFALLLNAYTDFIYVVLYFLKVAWFILFSTYLTASVLVSGILMLLLAIISGIGVYKSIKNKNFPSVIKMSFIAFVFYVLVLPSNFVHFENLSWQKNATEITSILEKQEFGVFYNWWRSLSDGDGYHYYYSIAYEDEEYLIQMSPESVYSLDPSHLDFEDLSLDFDDFPFAVAVSLPDGLVCEVSSYVYPEGELSDDYVLVLGGETDCDSLTYEGEVIYSKKDVFYPLMIENAIFSSDGKYLLLQFGFWEEGSEIYLVEME